MDNVHKYESLEALLADCNAEIDRSWIASGWSRDDGGIPVAEAIELATHGWKDGLKHMARFTSRITERVKASLPSQTMFWDTTGQDFDMGMAINGEPECWYDFAPKDETKFCHIGVNLFYSCGVGHDVINMRGGAICAIVDALESIGYRCEITCVVAATDYDQYAMSTVVKNFGDALDLDRLAFITTHPAMFRRVVATNASKFSSFHSRGGFRCDEKHDINKGFDIYFEQLRGYAEEFRDFNKCEAKILDLLRKQGVDIQAKMQGD